MQLRKPYRYCRFDLKVHAFLAQNSNSLSTGADFLANYGLLVDLQKRHVIDPLPNIKFSDKMTDIKASGIKILSTATGSGSNASALEDIVIVHLAHMTAGPPISCAKAEYASLIAEGILRSSSSSWSSPLHLVPKIDGNYTPCGNYRVLNTRTVPNKYLVPNIENFCHSLHGKKIFSTIDLVKAYHQITGTGNQKT